MRSLVGLVCAVLVIGCGSAASGGPAAPTVVVTASASRGVECSWTKPRNAAPPPLPDTRDDGNALFVTRGTALFVHWNETLALRLPADGTLLVGPGGDGVKLGWIRLKAGALAVTAKRLDLPGPVRVDLADNYGNSGLQITGIRFPGAGCYEVTGSVAGGPPLTFVTRIAQR